jgi:predicted RecB family nuclease
VAVQFSCHIEEGFGAFEHREWLADGPEDPRPAIAAALVKACRGANAVLTYTGFETTQIRRLAAAVPAIATELQDLDGRLVDLAKIVRAHVYHPEFGGSFSLKEVLPALVPELRYDDLEVNDGQVASARLNRMLLRGDPATAPERASLRANLLAYCKMDTWAMVKLVERLRALGS